MSLESSSPTYSCTSTMGSKSVRLTTSSFIFVWMSSIVFLQVAVGVPLPFRENHFIPSNPSKPLESPSASHTFKHAHDPQTNTYRGSNSNTNLHHFQGKGFPSRNAIPTAPGREQRHNEIHFAPPNDHRNHQNSYRHPSRYQNHQDRIRNDHQMPLDTNQHNSMHQQHQHPRSPFPRENFHQPPLNTLHPQEDPAELHMSSNDHLRQKRDANVSPHIVHFHNDWQPEQNEQSGSMPSNPSSSPVNGYCTTPDCGEKLASNNIRRTEPSNKYVYDEVRSKVQDPNSNNIRRGNNPSRVAQISPDQLNIRYRASSNDDRNSRSNNKIPSPSQILTPPLAVPADPKYPHRQTETELLWNQKGLNFLQQQNNNVPGEEFGQFYGQYSSPQQPPATYLDFPDVHSIPQQHSQSDISRRDSLSLDNSWNEINSFLTTSSPTSSFSSADASQTSPDVIRMSSFSIGPDGLVEVVKIILNFSNEDDEETQLEVEDQY